MTKLLASPSEGFRLFARRADGHSDPIFLGSHNTHAEAQAELAKLGDPDALFTYHGLVIAPPGFAPDFWL